MGVDSMDLQCSLGFCGFNKATIALDKLAGYEELEGQEGIEDEDTEIH